MHFPILQDILVILGFSVVIVFVLQRLKLPSILGFLVTGVVIGPFGLSLVSAVEEVEILSEIGVILLLFVIGIELSIKQLASIKKTVFIGGILQVSITVLVAALVYFSLGYVWNEALFVGFLFSLSSTAIVLKVLQERNEITSSHGRNALAVLIFQDIIVVPMMLLTPIIAGQASNVWMSILSLLIKSAVVVAITIVSARYIVPRLMHEVALTGSKELFLLTTITLCFAIAFLTSEAGLSLALGAFLAGLIISESEYSHQATGIILPFREFFTSFFFISVGMLLDLGFFLQHIGVISLLVFLVFIVKSSAAALAMAALRHTPKTVILTGLSLFQVGEFAFILSKVGIQYGLLNEQTNQYFLAVSIVSMLLTPFVIIYAEQIAALFLGNRLVKKAIVRKAMRGVPDSEAVHEAVEYHNHLIIIGYGINGANLAKAARFSKIPFVVIDLDAETVKQERKNGVPIIFGDAARRHTLEAVNLLKARAVVVLTAEPSVSKAIIAGVRALSHSVYLLVKTRFVKEIPELIAIGADEVIPEEFETSIEIFSRVMHNFLVPEDDIQHCVDTIRAHNYELFKSKKKLPKTFRPTQEFPDFNITCLKVNRDSGKLLKKPLKELALRTTYQINILGISRNGQMLSHILPEEVLLPADAVFVHGKPENIERFHRMIE